MKKALYLLVFTAGLSGCISAGREVTQNDMAGIEKGKTTAMDIQRRLGKPQNIATDSDGKQSYTYFFVHSQARPESFIPFVGAFVGGADTRQSSAIFFFDQSGVLQNYSQSQGSAGASQNLSASGYQAPDRATPKASE